MYELLALNEWKRLIPTNLLYFLICMKFNQFEDSRKIFSNLSDYGFRSCLIRKSWISSSNKLIHIWCTYTYTCIHKHAYIHILEFKYHECIIGWNIYPQKDQICRVYSTRVWQINMEDEEHTHYDAHFQEALNSLKVSMVRIASLLEEMLRIPLVKARPIGLSLLLKLKQ